MRDEKIRVLQVITRLGVGGPALMASVLLRGLDPERFDHRLYTGSLAEGEADYRALRAPDVPVHMVPELGRSVRALDDLRALAKLTRAMREFRPDIVHTHCAKAGILGRLAAAATGVPARVHTFHGHLLHGYFGPVKTGLIVRAERTMGRLSTRLVTVGDQIRTDLLEAGIGTPDQYYVIPPGTSLGPLPSRAHARAQLGLPQDAPVVAYVGRVTRIKRPDRLAEVARLVTAAMPEARFVVCGSGDLLPEIADEPALRHLGWRADVETVYAAADAILLTSDNEGTPLSLIEAAHAGVPAVSTDVGSVSDVVTHAVTGFLTIPDARALAAHLIPLLRDPALRDRLGRNARLVAADRFADSRFVSEMEAVYESLSRRAGRVPVGV